MREFKLDRLSGLGKPADYVGGREELSEEFGIRSVKRSISEKFVDLSPISLPKLFNFLRCCDDATCSGIRIEPATSCSITVQEDR